MQSCDKRLLQPHEEIPREELPAVSMSGQLQMKTCIGGGRGAARLVGQQEPQGGVGWGAPQGGMRITAVLRDEMVGARIRDAGYDHGTSVVLQDHVSI